MSLVRHQRAFRNLTGIANSGSSRQPVTLPEPDIRPHGCSPSFPVDGTIDWDWVVWAEPNCRFSQYGWNPPPGFGSFPGQGDYLGHWKRLDGSGQDLGNVGSFYHRHTAGLNGQRALRLSGATDEDVFSNPADATIGAVPSIPQPFTIAMVIDYEDGGWLFNSDPTVPNGDGSFNPYPTGSGGFGTFRVAQLVSQSITTDPWLMRFGGTYYAFSTVDATMGPHLIVAVANGSSSRLTVDGTTVIGPTDVGSSDSGDTIMLGSLRHGHIETPPNGFEPDPMVGSIAFGGLTSGVIDSAVESNLLAWSRSFYATP